MLTDRRHPSRSIELLAKPTKFICGHYLIQNRRTIIFYTINDFTSGEDLLGIGGIENVAEFDDLVLLGNSDTTISVLGNDIAILLGVTPDSLSADDFVFAAGFN